MAIRKIDNPYVTYVKRTEKSHKAMKEAEKYLPGGVTANIKHFSPYPIVMETAKGALIKDVDGNQYIDYLMGYGSLALGHGHEKIINAIQDQLLKDGTVLFGTPHSLEYKFARKIQSFYPSMEKIRFTNSGTEATLLALRLALAYTGKKKIAKFEGHYHGGYNEVLYSINPSLTDAGAEDAPNSVPESSGLELFDDQKPIVLPFNNIKGTEKILKEHAHELAAVIIEPVQGGFIPADRQFIKTLRELTEKYNILLVFDEVKTGFRVSLGGAQEVYNVKPDLTTLGKVVGGGFPIGIVGGKADIVNMSRPTESGDVFDIGQGKTSSAKEVLFHSGTYNGHPTILAAGLATIDHLEKDFDRIVVYTNELKKGIEEIGKKSNVPLKTIGIGSIFSVICSNKKISNYRDLQQTDLNLRKEIDFHLLNEGIYTKPLNRYSISAVHGEKELEATLGAYDVVLNHRLGGGI